MRRLILSFFLFLLGAWCLSGGLPHFKAPLRQGFVGQARAAWPGSGIAKCSGCGAPSYTGPGDIVTTWKAWWGLRCFKNSYAGNVADIWDSATGDTTETLLTCSAGGTINQTVHSLSTTCSSGCVVKTLYDQSGANSCLSSAPCNLTQATLSQMPTLTVSCQNSRPCLTFSAASSQLMLSTTLAASLSQPFMFVGVSERTGSTSNYDAVLTGGVVGSLNIGLYYNDASGQYFAGGIGNITLSGMTDPGWYACQGYFNGSSSTAECDAASNSKSGTGSLSTTGLTTLSLFNLGNDAYFSGSYTMNGYIAEAGVSTSAYSSSLASNMRSYWNF